jgi:hypothetical protein
MLSKFPRYVKNSRIGTERRRLTGICGSRADAPAAKVPGKRAMEIDTDKIVGRSNLLGRLRDVIRRKHYNIPTEESYLQ